jgi:hypothetical protein
MLGPKDFVVVDDHDVLQSTPTRAHPRLVDHQVNPLLAHPNH